MTIMKHLKSNYHVSKLNLANTEMLRGRFSLKCLPILLEKKVRVRTLFVPYLEPSGKRVPKRVLYMFKNLKRFRI